MGNNYLWHKLFAGGFNCQSSLKEWEVSCVLRQGWLVQGEQGGNKELPLCRERGKDEFRKHDSFEQNECGCPLLTQGVSALPLGLFMAIQTSQVGW